MDPSSTSSTEKLNSSYDYIIIGGGTAGLTIACRLSEDPNIQILVIEAGANRLKDPNILTPGLVGALYDNSDYDWEFKTVPQVGNTIQTRTPRSNKLIATRKYYRDAKFLIHVGKSLVDLVPSTRTRSPTILKPDLTHGKKLAIKDGITLL
jgi:choline dehydrogenase-like flavoprotein